MFPPLPDDLPRDELAKLAEEAIYSYPAVVMVKAKPEEVSVYFKFTCKHCGERCTLEEANSLYENGICASCNKETPITYGGFTLIIRKGEQANGNA